MTNVPGIVPGTRNCPRNVPGTSVGGIVPGMSPRGLGGVGGGLFFRGHRAFQARMFPFFLIFLGNSKRIAYLNAAGDNGNTRPEGGRPLCPLAFKIVPGIVPRVCGHSNAAPITTNVRTIVPPYRDAFGKYLLNHSSTGFMRPSGQCQFFEAKRRRVLV